MPERCMCGAPDCRWCGPLQGYPEHYRECDDCGAPLEWDRGEERYRPCEACATASRCPECGEDRGPGGWCPDCSEPLSSDDRDDTGGDPDPGLTSEGV
jgi:hypothetical protein